MVCFLLSDWASLTTGEMVHVDGGFHALGIGAGEADDQG
jgi:enoyl-[acyl-carrier protein] reductase I